MKNVAQITLISLFILGISSTSFALTKHQIEHTSAIQNFIAQMINKYHYDENELMNYLSKAEINAEILQKISKPYETKPWDQYQKFFLTDERINLGADLWNNYTPLLTDVEAQYGVPAPIIIAILGVETSYGRNTGHYHVLDALATLAFYYPPRSKFFTSEFKNYLLLCRELNLSAHKIRGSYAGAMGLPQFMPSSYRNYAVDFENKGKIDLMENQADSIASIGNYLKKHGWQENNPVALPVTFKNKEAEKKILAEFANSSFDLETWREKGVDIPQEFKQNLTARLIALKSKKDIEYWLAFNNFDVILSYNKSPQYAMSVYLLSRRITQQYALAQPDTFFD